MINRLVHLQEFKDALAHHFVADDNKDTLDKTILALMVAPTSVGRNTIIRELLKSGKYHYIVSDTTRHPRVNDGVPERNGVEYWFRPQEEVLADLTSGKYLEAAIIHNQQVSGISVHELEQAMREGRIATTDIEIAGVEKIMPAKPDTIAFFVLPPNFEEWQRRIKHRGHMDENEYCRRLESAGKEFQHALENPYYYFVINDSIYEVVEQINHRAVDGKIDKTLQQQARKLAQELYEQTQKVLEK